jgi:imidazolonepropionase-like amidohydrolase
MRLRSLILAAFVAALVPSGRAATPRVHAIVGARIVAAPGQVIERGTVVVRDGLIAAVGADAAVPPDARVFPGEGLTVYAGLIDAFVVPASPSPSPSPAGGSAGPRTEAPRGAAHALASVTPERRMADEPPLGKDQVEALRSAGFAVAQVAPGRGILRGQSAVFALSGASPNKSLVKADAAQVVALNPERGTYPGSLMGAVAVVRQAFKDAAWYRGTPAPAKGAAGAPRAPSERLEANPAWSALGPALSGTQPVMFVADEMLETLRAGALAREAGLKAQIVGAGDEYKRARDIAGLGVPLVVPVAFPEAPDVADPDAALEVSIQELRHWHQGPGNAGALVRAGVSCALTSHGLKDAKTFRANVAKAIERGLTPKDALAAVTTVPARLLGLEDTVGTVAVGKAAHLTVTRGELFAEKTRVVEVWVDGERFEVTDKDDPGAKGRWSLAWGGTTGTLVLAQEKEPSAKLTVGADTLTGTDVRIEGRRASFAVERAGTSERFDLTIDRDQVSGSVVAASAVQRLKGSRAGDPEPDASKEGAESDAKKAAAARTPIETPQVMGDAEAWRARTPEAPTAILVRDAQVWTAGPAGSVRGDLLITGGRITAVGPGLRAPADALVIDAGGRHVTPGLIDAHSHSAIVGGVNECTNVVTAEVRVEDVVNSEAVSMYRQLAGGTTVMHLLHGSCNAIGGQGALIKNKWGEAPDRLRFAGAPPTIKFALGENPKRSNAAGLPGAQTRRYPATRPGVEQVIREAFTKARDHKAALADFAAGRRPRPPRPDLQTEAVLEILDGKRLIHAHAYRQDEILMLMRLCEEFGIKVRTFQHILEGYKVADEMAAHGASGSSFSDWWGYKYEVIDAIPYNGFLMWDRGVSVSFNSDSDELARMLNVEAGKAVKYGAVPPEEAIKFVTSNPARQLGIEGRVGSLEAGKDADFVIWTGDPLSPASRVDMTFIEGRKYFDREADLAGRDALAREREALVARARTAKKGKPGDGGGGRGAPPRYLEPSGDETHACGADAAHEVVR